MYLVVHLQEFTFIHISSLFHSMNLKKKKKKNEQDLYS